MCCKLGLWVLMPRGRIPRSHRADRRPCHGRPRRAVRRGDRMWQHDVATGCCRKLSKSGSGRYYFVRPSSPLRCLISTPGIGPGQEPATRLECGYRCLAGVSRTALVLRDVSLATAFRHFSLLNGESDSCPTVGFRRVRKLAAACRDPREPGGAGGASS